MTPEKLQSVRARVSALRGGITPGADPVRSAIEARQLFEDGGDDVRVRWMNLELAGYDAHPGPLCRALGVGEDDRLALHVAAYRNQRARAPDGELIHFFVEPLAHLVAAAEKVRRLGTRQDVQLSFPSATLSYPKVAVFPPSVFNRILEGFLAALHLQLTELVRAA